MSALMFALHVCHETPPPLCVPHPTPPHPTPPHPHKQRPPKQGQQLKAVMGARLPESSAEFAAVAAAARAAADCLRPESSPDCLAADVRQWVAGMQVWWEGRNKRGGGGGGGGGGEGGRHGGARGAMGQRKPALPGGMPWRESALSGAKAGLLGRKGSMA
jgi:hypothetical protein